MSEAKYEIVFGPVPSRRLGQSLGINNIPPKHCSLSCVYCQLGCTTQMGVTRQTFYEPELLARAVEAKLQETTAQGGAVDYLTFVADGEPTLDRNLGREIALLKPLGIKVAVISNTTLLWRGDVRNDLSQADLVSLKVDAVDERAWLRINRPHGSLSLHHVQQGMLAFAAAYRGTLITETMLVRGVNDGESGVRATAAFLRDLKPARAYLAVPIRPPAEHWVQAPSRQAINRAYMILCASVAHVECLVEHEADNFVSTGQVSTDLMSIMSVHPMREQAVVELLTRAGADWSVVENLVAQGKLTKQRFEGVDFYQRRFDA